MCVTAWSVFIESVSKPKEQRRFTPAFSSYVYISYVRLHRSQSRPAHDVRCCAKLRAPPDPNQAGVAFGWVIIRLTRFCGGISQPANCRVYRGFAWSCPGNGSKERSRDATIVILRLDYATSAIECLFPCTPVCHLVGFISTLGIYQTPANTQRAKLAIQGKYLLQAKQRGQSASRAWPRRITAVSGTAAAEQDRPRTIPTPPWPRGHNRLA